MECAPQPGVPRVSQYILDRLTFPLTAMRSDETGRVPTSGDLPQRLTREHLGVSLPDQRSLVLAHCDTVGLVPEGAASTHPAALLRSLHGC